MSWSRRVFQEEEEEVMMEVEEQENFLPMASLRVLLVEGDDSTRHIISALLRKCNYKVAAVSDGLKAWEMLKENPQGIDVVLAEMEAPSVSGLDLLTMITDREPCKNIPVIMMSSHDSITMVYKCMLKGAADFLVKPVRRNELRNLWQHVWRRHSFTDIHTGRSSSEDENLSKRKHEDMSEKEENLSGYAPSSKKHKGCSDKASQADSSCTRLEMEAESTYRQNRNGHKLSEFKECQAESNNSHSVAMLSSEVKSFNVKCASNGRGCSCALIDTMNEDAKPTESVSYNGIDNYQDTAPNEAIDLIGTMDIQLENDYSIVDEYASSKSSSLPILELSLRGYQQSSFEEERGECSTLNQSNSSAFLRYNGRTAVSTRLTPMTFRADGEECSGRFIPDQGSGSSSTALGWYDADVRFPTQNGKAIKCSPRRFVPLPAMNFDCSSSTYGQRMARLFSLQPLVSPSCDNIQVIDKSSLKDEQSRKQETNVETRGEQVHLSYVGDSGSSSVCNGTQDHLNNNMTNSDAENGVKIAAGICRSSQREAALNKFRMKRKDRCFEKKIRYQSRKNLAEHRPRVKGQFVRRVQPEPAPTVV